MILGRLHGRAVNSGPCPIASFERSTWTGFAASSSGPLTSTSRRAGVEPKNPFSGTLNLRLGPGLHQRAALSAGAQGMSLNSWIEQAVEKPSR